VSLPPSQVIRRGGVSRLKLEPHAKPHVEREVERDRLEKVHVGLTHCKLCVLVRQANLCAVEDVEEVCNQVQFRLLT